MANTSNTFFINIVSRKKSRGFNKIKIVINIKFQNMKRVIVVALIIILLYLMLVRDTRPKIVGKPVKKAGGTAPGGIDAVVTWVNSNDPSWLQAKQKHQVRSTGDLMRFPIGLESDLELTLCLELIMKNISWVRKIFLVMCCSNAEHLPRCLFDVPVLKEAYENGRIVIVLHSEIFDVPEDLPTFNSHAIEANLHRIPDLSEHFIYLNDDMFILKELQPTAFFVSDLPIVRKSRYFSKFFSILSGLSHGWANVSSYFFQHQVLFLNHNAQPLTKTILARAEKTIPEQWSKTSSAKFRSTLDTPPIGFAVNLACYEQKMVELEEDDVISFYDLLESHFSKSTLWPRLLLLVYIFREKMVENLKEILEEEKPHMICLSELYCSDNIECLKGVLQELRIYSGLA
jgi:hypothetical protein